MITLMKNEKYTLTVDQENYTVCVRDKIHNLVAYSEIRDEYENSIAEFVEDYFFNAKYIV